MASSIKIRAYFPLILLSLIALTACSKKSNPPPPAASSSSSSSSGSSKPQDAPAVFSGLSSSPMTIAPGAAEPVTFFTQVSSLATTGTLELEEVDADGKLLASLGKFTDSGDSGDTRRGDGIFSLQVSLQAEPNS